MQETNGDQAYHGHASTGIPVDSSGGPTIDPTRNVLDLVNAESTKRDLLRDADAKYQDAMRQSQEKLIKIYHDTGNEFQNFAREAEANFSKTQRDAESKRLDQLADLRQIYDTRIADILAESVRSTSGLVSTQLLQIQSTFDARVSKLEEFRLLSTGRSSVADPQLAGTLNSITSSVSQVQASFEEAIDKIAKGQTEALSKMADSIAKLKTIDDRTEGRGLGRNQVIGYIATAATMAGVIVGIAVKLLG